MVGPHLAGEGVIFSITQRNRRAALAMGRQSEANGIPLDFDPQVTTGIARSPAHKHHRIVFVKSRAPLQGIGIEGFKHLRQATLPHNTPRILLFSRAPRLIRLLAQYIFRVYIVLTRNNLLL